MHSHRIEALSAERAGKVAIAEGLHQKAADESRLLNHAEQAAFVAVASDAER